MEVFEAIRKVRAVRAYDGKPVAHDTVRKIVEAGRLSGSAVNKQPWHFVVVEQRDTLTKLGELAQHGPYTAQASFAIVVCIEKGPYTISDASRAIQNMVLAAFAEGVYSNWVGFADGRLDSVKPVLGIPHDLDILAILPFGYPTDASAPGTKKRKPLEEVASLERFDQPFR